MSRNDITGAVIRSKNDDAEARKRFEEGFDRIFGKKPSVVTDEHKADLLKPMQEKRDYFEGEFK